MVKKEDPGTVVAIRRLPKGDLDTLTEKYTQVQFYENIIPVTDIFEDKDMVIFVFEHFLITLQHAVRCPTLPSSCFGSILYEVLKGLYKLQANGFSPKASTINVFICQEVVRKISVDKDTDRGPDMLLDVYHVGYKLVIGHVIEVCSSLSCTMPK